MYLRTPTYAQAFMACRLQVVATRDSRFKQCLCLCLCMRLSAFT